MGFVFAHASVQFWAEARQSQQVLLVEAGDQVQIVVLAQPAERVPEQVKERRATFPLGEEPVE